MLLHYSNHETDAKRLRANLPLCPSAHGSKETANRVQRSLRKTPRHPTLISFIEVIDSARPVRHDTLPGSTEQRAEWRSGFANKAFWGWEEQSSEPSGILSVPRRAA